MKSVPRRTQQSAVGEGFTITQFHHPAESKAQMRDRLRQNELDPRLENMELNHDSRGCRSVYPQVAHEYLNSRNRFRPPNEQNLIKSGSWSQPFRNSSSEPTRPEGEDYSSNYRTVNSGRNIEEARASTQRFQQRTGWDNPIQANSEMRMPAQSSPH